MNNKIMLRLSVAALGAIALLSLSSCSTAQVKDVWTAPDVTKLSFKKVLIIAATKDGASRRTFEDSAVASVSNITAVPSYAFLTGDLNMDNVAKLSADIKAAGFDGVVIMRMIGDRSEVNVYQDMSYPVGYRSFGGYYGRYAMMGYNSTTVTTDRIISVETNIYEFPGEKLVWTGVTESTSPGNIKVLVTDAVESIRQHMVKQGLIPAPAK